jgi:hypothetical protein
MSLGWGGGGFDGGGMIMVMRDERVVWGFGIVTGST